MCDSGEAALFFFFNDTATTEIYTLSLHDALPIFHDLGQGGFEVRGHGRAFAVPVRRGHGPAAVAEQETLAVGLDRKSTRLNSSHANISYAVFCLKKKKHTCHEPSNRHSTLLSSCQ